jgi:hypothetical protein
MRYPKRLRKARQGPPAGNARREDWYLRLAECAAPFGEEMPWKIVTEERAEPADPWRELKPERGRLH